MDAAHLTIQQRARKLLRRYRELRSIVNALGIDNIPAPDGQLYKRGERLESFLAQPFFVAEPYTQKAGEWLSLYDTLEDVKRILDGEMDGVEPSELFFRGRLEVRA